MLPLVLAILLTASASSIFINSSSDLKYYSDENLSVRITNESEIVLPSDGDPAGNQDLAINLSQVLTAGNRPGNNDIDLDGQSLRRVDELNPIGVTNLNISSNTSFQNSTVVNVSIGGPPSVVDKEYVDRADVFVGDNQTLDEVLDIGNSAGNNDIFLNDNNLTDTGNLTTNTSLRLGEPGRIYLPSGGPVTSSDTVLGNLSQVLRGGNEAGEFDILLNDNNLEEVNALNPGESQNITVGVGLELRNNTIRNLSEPTQPGQAATKQYVDTTEDTIIQDNQDLKDVLGQGRSAGSFDINLTGQEIIDTSGPLTLRGETEVAGGNLSLNDNNITQVNRINGQLVQDLGTNNLTEVLNEGNKASTNINLSGNNITEVNRINGQLVQNLGTSSLSEVLTEGSKTGGTDIDLDDTNLTDTGKGNVTIGQDLKIYGNLWVPGVGSSGGVGSQNLSQVLREGNNASTSINMSGNRITNLSDPTNPQDAATKSYVDTTDNTIEDDQTLRDALSRGNRVGGEGINFNESSGIQSDGQRALGFDSSQNVATENGDLNLSGHNLTSHREICAGNQCP